MDLMIFCSSVQCKIAYLIDNNSTMTTGRITLFDASHLGMLERSTPLTEDEIQVITMHQQEEMQEDDATEFTDVNLDDTDNTDDH
jgi:hypothetical protein